MVNPVRDSSSIEKISQWIDIFLLFVLVIANLLFPLFGLSAHLVSLVRLLFLLSLVLFFIFVRLPLLFVESVVGMLRSHKDRKKIWRSRKNFLIKNLVFILVFLFVLDSVGANSLHGVIGRELLGRKGDRGGAADNGGEAYGLVRSSEKEMFVLRAKRKDFKSEEDVTFKVSFTDALPSAPEENEASGSSSQPSSATTSATPETDSPSSVDQSGSEEPTTQDSTPEGTESATPEATISAQPSNQGLLGKVLALLEKYNIFGSVKAQSKEPDIDVKIFDVEGEETHFPISVEADESGNFEIEVSKGRAFRPGKYELKVTLVDPESGEELDSIEQDFTWGVLAVNTNKSIYLPREKAKLQMAVLDEEGMMECNAKLRLEIQNPKSEIQNLSTEEGSITVNPECKLHDFTLVPDYEAEYQVADSGVYEMKLTAETENGTYTITDSFEVRNEVPFDVERETATRIYPPESYPVTFSIKVNQDFTGVIEERVPASFEVECPPLFDVDSGTRSNSCQIKEKDGVKTISWSVSWAEGQRTTLYYRFKTPLISPQFYLLGPLTFRSLGEGGPSTTVFEKSEDELAPTSFEEARRWQLAIDDTEGANSPSSAAEDTSVGGYSWSGYTNVYSSNDSYAEVTLGKGYISYYIKATGFGFSLSNCESIDGIYVEVERKSNDAADMEDNSVRLVNGSGTIVGDDKAIAGDWPTSDTYQGYGGSTDTWNASLTCSDVTNSNFGVVFSAQNTVSTKPRDITASVDHIRVTVYYTAAPALEQSHYRWRDDSYGLNTDNGWQANEDNEYNGLPTNTTARLRMEIDNTGDAEASSYQYQLEYAAQSGDTCGGESYTAVPVTASTEPFEMVTSSQYTDGDAITSGFLTGSGTWADGEGVADPSNKTASHSLAYGDYTEFEYAIQATSDAGSGQTYCFRLTNDGSIENFTYTRYAEATIQGVSGSLGKSADGWAGAIPVYMDVIGYDSSYYARAKVDTPAAETYYFDMTWDSGNSRFEGTIYPGSYYCNGCADPNTGTFTVTVQIDDDSGFGSINDSDSTGSFDTYITRRKSSLDTSENYTDIKPVWNTDHWDIEVADFALYCSSSQTNAVIAVPFHPTTASISNIAVSYDGTAVSQGSAESTTDAWWWDSDYHTLFLMFGSCSTTIVDVDISFDSDTDLWATRFDRVQTADMGNREFYNGLFIGNQYWTTSVYGGGHEGAGEQAESRAKPSGGDELTVDCMERVGVWADDDGDPNTIDDLNCDDSGYYECNVKWAQDEWDDWPLSEDNDSIVVETNEDQTASTGWRQYLDNSISVERILTFYSGKIYIENNYTITNNDSSAHDLDLVHEREQWLAGDCAINDRGRYYSDTSDRTMDTRVDMSTFSNPWLTSYDNYDTGYYASMGFIFEEGAEADYGIFTDHAFITNTSAEWPVVIGSEGHTEAANTGFELSNNSVAAGNSVVLNYWQTLYIGSSWDDVASALDDACAELNDANTAPNSPTSLTQKKTDDTVLSTGDWTNESSVKFTATVDDPDDSDTLYLCVEKDPTGTAFSDTEDQCGEGVSYSGTAVEATVTISSQTDDTEYHWQARVKDEAGEYSSWVSYGGNADPSDTDYAIDTTAPTGGTVYDGTEAGVDKDFNDESLSQLSANWSGFDASVSGLDYYEYSIGTTQGGIDVVGWTNNGTSTSVTEQDLTLQTSQPYYFNVRAVDNAGSTQSPAISSDGQLVSPSISFSVSPSTVSFDALNASNSYTDTETVTLETSTNAYNGYVVRGFATDYLRSASGNETVPDFDGGTYEEPDGWLTSDRGFGYHSSDESIQGSNIFNSDPCPGGNSPPCYAPFSQTAPGDIVADHTANVTGSPISSEQFTLTYKVKTDSIQASSTYITTIIYTITAQY
ncbi:MAG: hypothetical protein U9M98_02285 [Patescibacteria group bacterium]|nr:hypothetical protein [Patescibacteria group bacterium]